MKQTIFAVLLFLINSLFFSYASYGQGRLLDDPDIASYRPRFPPPLLEAKKEVNTPLPLASNSKIYRSPKLDVTWKLNKSLDSAYQKNKAIKFAEGYRVLVYSGTDPNAMNEVKQKVYRLFSNIEIYPIFKAPEYRVTFGDFIDKIQAYEYLVKILPQVPNALIIQEQINIIRR